MAGQKVYSALGVGFGPANLSLAVALEEAGFPGEAHFIERATAFQWQDEQLLPGADIQNNPFRDLAMPRNPDSAHTFVKYLLAHGSLTEYLHINMRFPSRREYAGYLRWVAAAFRRSVDYEQAGTGISLVRHGGEEVFQVSTAAGPCRLARAVVLGTGRSPRVAPEFQQSLGATTFHSTRYLSSINRLRDRDIRVAVVGSSQSAIEIVLDLLGRPNVTQVHSIQRGIGFRLKDTSPYSRQVFLPEFVDYFHSLPSAVKTRLRADLRSINYGACDQDVIDRLTVVQRECALTGSDRLSMIPFSQVAEVRANGSPGGSRLLVREVNHHTRSVLDVDVVVLATGFRDFGAGQDDERHHPLLGGLVDRLLLDGDGVPVVARDYSVQFRAHRDGKPAPKLYLNGLCEASHGMGDAGALAMLSVRSTDIMESLMRREADGVGDQRLTAEASR